MKRSTSKRRLFGGLAAALSALLLCVCFATAFPVPTAAALTAEELQEQLAEYEKKLQEDKAALAELKDNTADAKKKKANLESQIKTIKQQISVMLDSIASLQSSISGKETEIAEKQLEIEAKQADIDSQWAGFQQRVGAMQEMRDSGAMAMLSTVQNLYQLLTFNDVLQDISAKDTEILDNMKAQKDALEQAKAELEQEKADLEAQQAELESQKKQLASKQDELADDLVEAGNNLVSAQQAQDEAQALVDSDQMDYNAAAAELQKLYPPTDYSDMVMDGSFICPLASYTRISDKYGYRTHPITGVRKLHAGVDFAAPAGTPIRAAASGIVTVSTFSSSYGYYILIYHGKVGDTTYSTLYAHMQGYSPVAVGATVSQGDTIGYVGSSGSSTGYHLHLELWQGTSSGSSLANLGNRIDPAGSIPIPHN